MKKLPKKNSKERGQSLVELGISLMVLLMLLTGSVEIGIALFQYVTIRDAAQEGALYASIALADTPRVTTVGEAVQAIKWRTIQTADDVTTIAPDNIQVFINQTIEITEASPATAQYCEGTTNGVPNSITVIVRFAHPITFPLVAPMIGTDVINLTASATNTILQPTCAIP